MKKFKITNKGRTFVVSAKDSTEACLKFNRRLKDVSFGKGAGSEREKADWVWSGIRGLSEGAANSWLLSNGFTSKPSEATSGNGWVERVYGSVSLGGKNLYVQFGNDGNIQGLTVGDSKRVGDDLRSEVVALRRSLTNKPIEEAHRVLVQKGFSFIKKLVPGEGGFTATWGYKYPSRDKIYLEMTESRGKVFDLGADLDYWGKYF